MSDAPTSKEAVVLKLLSEGDTMLCLDACHQGVRVPPQHANNHALRLILNLNFPQPIEITAQGVSANLAFGGRRYTCYIPMQRYGRRLIPTPARHDGRTACQRKSRLILRSGSSKMLPAPHHHHSQPHAPPPTKRRSRGDVFWRPVTRAGKKPRTKTNETKMIENHHRDNGGTSALSNEVGGEEHLRQPFPRSGQGGWVSTGLHRAIGAIARPHAVLQPHSEIPDVAWSQVHRHCVDRL